MVWRSPHDLQTASLGGPLLAVWTACHCERRLKQRQVSDTDIASVVQLILINHLTDADHSRNHGRDEVSRERRGYASSSSRSSEQGQILPLHVTGSLAVGVAKMYSKQLELFSKRCAELLLKMRDSEPTKSKRRKALQVVSEEDDVGHDVPTTTRRRHAVADDPKGSRERVKQRLLGEIDEMVLMDKDLTDEAILQSLTDRAEWPGIRAGPQADMLMSALPVLGLGGNQTAAVVDGVTTNSTAKSKKTGGRFLEESSWAASGDIDELLAAAPQAKSFHHIYDMDFDFQDRLLDGDPVLRPLDDDDRTSPAAAIPLVGASFGESQESNDAAADSGYDDGDIIMAGEGDFDAPFASISETAADDMFDSSLLSHSSSVATTLLQDDSPPLHQSQQSHANDLGDDYSTQSASELHNHRVTQGRNTSPWQVLLSAERGRGVDDKSNALNLEAHMESELAAAGVVHLSKQDGAHNLTGAASEAVEDFMSSGLANGSGEQHQADVLDVLVDDTVDIIPSVWDDKETQQGGLLSASRPSTAGEESGDRRRPAWRLSDVSSVGGGTSAITQFLDDSPPLGTDCDGSATATTDNGDCATEEQRTGQATSNGDLLITPPQGADGYATPLRSSAATDDVPSSHSGAAALDDEGTPPQDGFSGERVSRKRRRMNVRGSSQRDASHAHAVQDGGPHSSESLPSSGAGRFATISADQQPGVDRRRRSRKSKAAVSESRGLQIVIDDVTIVGDEFWKQAKESLENPQMSFTDDDGHSICFFGNHAPRFRKTPNRTSYTFPVKVTYSVAPCGRLTCLTRCQEVATAVGQYHPPASSVTTLSQRVLRSSNRGEAFQWALKSFLNMDALKRNRSSIRPASAPASTSTKESSDAATQEEDTAVPTTDVAASVTEGRRSANTAPDAADMSNGAARNELDQLQEVDTHNSEQDRAEEQALPTCDPGTGTAYTAATTAVQSEGEVVDAVPQDVVEESGNSAAGDSVLQRDIDSQQSAADDYQPYADTPTDCSPTLDLVVRDEGTACYSSNGDQQLTSSSRTDDTLGAAFDDSAEPSTPVASTDSRRPRQASSSIDTDTLPIDEDEMLWFLESYPTPSALTDTLDTPPLDLVLPLDDEGGSWGSSQGLSFATATPSINFYNQAAPRVVCSRPQRLLLIIKKRVSRRPSVAGGASDSDAEQQQQQQPKLCFQDLLKHSCPEMAAVAFFDLLVLSCQGVVKVVQPLGDGIINQGQCSEVNDYSDKGCDHQRTISPFAAIRVSLF